MTCTTNGPTQPLIEWIPPRSAYANVINNIYSSSNTLSYGKDRASRNDDGVYVCRVNSRNQTKQKESRVRIVSIEDSTRRYF